MYSSRLTDRRPWAHPRGWTLRAKLLAAILALFTVVSLVVGVVSTVALREFLIGQLDQQLTAVSDRVVGSGPRRIGPPRPPPGARGSGADLVPLGQPVNTIGARLVDGQVETGLILTDARFGRGAVLTPLTARESDALVSVPVDGRPHSVTLGDLGDYRLVAVRLTSGDVVVTGLPMAGVQATVWRLVWTEAVVVGFGILMAGALGVLIVRLSLRPLFRVADTAGRVAELPLAKGEVDLSVRVPDAYTDPRTEVGRVGAAFNRMLGHVAQALAVRQASETRVRQFVADASHELRTPLAAIRGYAELTRRGREPVPADIGHALLRIESESVRMTTLVNDLLLLARLDSGRPLEREPVDLSRLLVDAVNDAHACGREHRWLLDLADDMADSDAPDSNVADSNATDSNATHSNATHSNATHSNATHSNATHSDAMDNDVLDNDATDSDATDSDAGPGRSVTVPGDGQRLHQVLANLLANARTHTPPATTVTASLTVARDQAVISVSDNGPGIPAQQMPDIFERFARGDGSRSRAAGSTGLGLAIVAAVVEAHHGTVEVASRPGHTVFVVRLPGAVRG